MHRRACWLRGSASAARGSPRATPSLTGPRPGGLLALYRDARAAPPQAWQTYHQCAQFLRRLREAAIRAGLPPDPDCWASGTAPQRPAAQRAPSPTSAPAVPFELRVPPAGRAREAFIRHVADVTRDFVTFTQGSAYTEAAAP